MSTKLRPFQAKLAADIHAAWDAGAMNVMPVAATGSGKTVLLSHEMHQEPGASVAIAHRQELVSQISTALARNGVRHRLVGAKKGSNLARVISALHVSELGYSLLDPNAKSGVGGVDTIIRMQPSDPYFAQVRLMVQDEAHHVLKANKWGKVAGMFPNARGLLPTATPLRADGKGLGRHADGLVDALVQAPGMREIINMGYLTDYRCYGAESDIKLTQEDISQATGDFNADKVRKAVHASTRIVGDVVRHYLWRAQGKLGVTFAVDVEAAGELAAAYRANGIPAEVVSAKTPDTLRAHILRRFKGREILQLVNVDLFGEGFDLPALEVVSFARPTASFALYAQQFGRVLRLMIPDDYRGNWDGLSDEQRREVIAGSIKPRGIILDHVGNIRLHNGPPDRPRVWTLDRREARRGGKSDAVPVRYCVNEECALPYERAFPCCPACGTEPPISDRSTPELVDGDLGEYSDELMAQFRGEIARMSGDFYAPSGLPMMAQMGARAQHQRRKEAHERLRNAIAWYGGLQSAMGRGESEGWRRFYFTYGIDVASAQILSAGEADELTMRVRSDLAAMGINTDINAAAYFSLREV